MLNGVVGCGELCPKVAPEVAGLNKLCPNELAEVGGLNEFCPNVLTGVAGLGESEAPVVLVNPPEALALEPKSPVDGKGC